MIPNYIPDNKFGFGPPIPYEDTLPSRTPQLPTITTPGGSTGGVLIQRGGSWYEDLLNTLLGLGAINRGATHIPSTNQGAYYAQQAAQQQQLSQLQLQALAAQRQPQGGGVAEDLGDFIRRNSTIILIGGLGYILWRSGRR